MSEHVMPRSILVRLCVKHALICFFQSREDGQLRSYAISPESFEQKEALGGRTDAYKGKVEKLKL